MRSCIVAWLRVLLPLAALVILSTLFLLPRGPNSDDVIPYADVNAEELARNPRMTRPVFAGVTDDGSAVTLTAASTSSLQGANGDANELRLTWRAPKGLAVDLTAPSGKIDGNRIQLSGGVRITTSSGWVLIVPKLATDSVSGRLEGTGGLNAFAPLGRVKADRMELALNSNGQHVLNLSGNVNLLYKP